MPLLYRCCLSPSEQLRHTLRPITQPPQLEAISVMAGVGGNSGDGQLHLPNLGTNEIWPFSVNGLWALVKVNVSKISPSGPVKNLTKLDDFPGGTCV